jgi:Tol biopolymer transport system component
MVGWCALWWLGSALVPVATAQPWDRDELLESRFRPQPHASLVTEHFVVHHPQHLQGLAERLAVIAEEVHVEVTTALGAEPAQRTHLVLTSQSDEPHIFTFTSPHPQIQLDVTLPHQGRGLNDFAEWHRWVLTHEYAHIVHIGMARGVYRLLEPVFGAWVLPQHAAPPWLKEGVASWLETELTPQGRGRSATWRMMLRTAVADGAFDYEATAWPWVFRPYLLGFELTRTIAESSEDGLRRYVHAAARRPPWHPGARRQVGIDSLRELWDTALERIRSEAEVELRAIATRPLTELQVLTDTGYLHSGLALAPNGRWLVVTHEGPRSDPQLLRLHLDQDGIPAESLLPRGGGTQSSFSASSRFLAFDSVSRAAYGDIHSDLYIYDLKEASVVTATRGARARDPTIHPDGRHVAFVVNQDGTNRLVRTDTAWADPVDLLGDVGYRRISTPRYAPAGDRLVVAVRGEHGGEDLWLVDRGRAELLVADGAENRHPSWTPDGGAVLFTSDRDGVFNIHRIEVDSRERQQLSHVVGGLFWPVVDPDRGWVYCTSYGSRGYDVARFRWDPDTWQPVTPSVSTSASVPADVAPDAVPAAHRIPYFGPRYMAPQYVLPVVRLLPTGGQVGGRLGAVDPLFFAHYDLELRYDLSARLPAGRAYGYLAHHPVGADVTVRAEVVPVAGAEPLYVGTVRAQLLVGLPPDFRRLYVRPGLVGSWIDLDAGGPIGGYSLAASWDTEFQQIGDSFPRSGTLLEVDLQHFVLSADPRRAPVSLIARARQHLSLPAPRHGLHLEATAGAFTGGGQQAIAAFVGGRSSFPLGLESQFLLLGVAPNRFVTPAVALGTSLYTFPLVDIEQGPGALPLFLGTLSGAIRLQGGALAGPEPLGSVGIELHQELVVGFLHGLTARLGVYQPLPTPAPQPTVLLVIEPAAF